MKIQEGCSPWSGTSHIRGLKKEALEQTLARQMTTRPLDADEGDDRDPLSSPPEYAEDIGREMETINWPAYFATPLTVSLETWRYDPHTRSAYQDGPTYNVYPVPDANPTLSVDMDLMALNEPQATFDRKMELDLVKLRQDLEDGFCEYGLERKQKVEKYVKKGTMCSETSSEPADSWIDGSGGAERVMW